MGKTTYQLAQDFSHQQNHHPGIWNHHPFVDPGQDERVLEFLRRPGQDEVRMVFPGGVGVGDDP